MRRLSTPWLALGLLLATAASLQAVGQGRISGTIVDEDGKPVADAEVTLRDPQGSFSKTFSTNNKGRFTATVLDATVTYEVDVHKAGYLLLKKSVKAPIGGVARPNWTLVASTGADSGSASIAQLAAGAEGSKKALKLFQEGADLYRANDADGAIAKFKEGIEIDPELVAGHAVLSRLYLDKEDREAALASAERALEIDPTSVVALEVQYDCLLAKGDAAGAEASLAALVAADQSRATAVRVYNAGVALIRDGDVDGGAVRLEQALAMSADLPPAYPALGNIYKQRGEHEKVLALADQLAAVDPESVESARLRYEAHQALGHDEEAAAAFAALKQKSPEKVAEALYDQGRELFNSGDSEGAVVALGQAIDAAPTHAKAHYLLGLAQVNLGKLAEAKVALSRFLELAPADPDAAAAQEMLQYLQSSG